MSVLKSPPPPARSKKQIEVDRRKQDQKKAAAKKAANPAATVKNLTAQSIKQDQQLGNVAGRALTRAQGDLNQGFNWQNVPQQPQAMNFDNLPDSPIQGDYRSFINQNLDQTSKDFENRFNDQFKVENQEFETKMRERGIPIGSDLYNNQKAQLDRSHNDAKQTMLRDAYAQGGTNATQYAQLGFQNRARDLSERQNQYQQRANERNDAVTAQQQQRYSNLNDYQTIRGAQYGYGPKAWDNQQGINAAMAPVNANNAAAMERQRQQLAAQYNPQNYDNTNMTYQQAVEYNRQQAQLAAAQGAPRRPNGYDALGQFGGGLLGGISSGIFK